VQEGPLDAGLGWSLILSSRLRDSAPAAALSVEDTNVIHDVVKRAPLTTRQFVEDHESLSSSELGRVHGPFWSTRYDGGEVRDDAEWQLTLVLLAHPWIE
jgi:hypothetical protein